jgi:translocation and assembly module TamB
VSLDWSTAFNREVTIGSVEMTDWQMLVEKWKDRHSFPKFGRDQDEPQGPKRFTTTMKYLRAFRGQFTYEDHEMPWSTVARNLDITITNLPNYHGQATFTGGTVTIQDFVPMWANMKVWFVIDGARIHLDRIDLETDGAVTVLTGDVDAGHWPEQTYQLKSRVRFPRMRELFFKGETWRLSGEGDFAGTFHLYKGGHDLRGTFASEMAGVNRYAFPALYGALHWTPTSFEVTDAGSRLFGGAARFTYSIAPLGASVGPTARFDATYADVDVSAFSDFQQMPGLRFAGRASGRQLLEWPLGRFVEQRAEGHLTVVPPAGVQPMGDSLAAERAADAGHRRHEWGPFSLIPLEPYLPVAGKLTYRLNQAEIVISPSRFATERTNVTFQGSTDWGVRSRFLFHVTSADWQESDQVLAGILTDFGSRTDPVRFGGWGEFDGIMTGEFSRPRVEGEFSGEDLRAWDTMWGAGAAHIAIENRYVTIRDGVVKLADSEIHADGKFSLGYPRGDGDEEINARFRIVRRDLGTLRHAFQIDDYPVSGQLSGEFHLMGQYEHPIGFGGMTIDHGVAYGEPFQQATASVRFDGSGVRLDGVTVSKGGGSVTGAAFVGWNGTYSFNADARRIPLDRVAAFAYPRAPLSGLLEFSAGGSATFEQPRYEVRFRVDDLFVAEEGVGQVTGTLAMRGRELSGEVQAASPRLAITGTGRIALTPQADAEISFRFHDSSLDPYVRLFVPRLSPFTTAVASGSIRIAGELADVDHLLIDGTVDTLDMRLFDYAIHNGGPIRLTLDQRLVRIEELQLEGEDTHLRVGGTISLHDQRIALEASGDANLGILQGFFRDVRGSGRAVLGAAIEGPLASPVFSGSATITDGRIRHFSLPNALDAINGRLAFDARGIRLDDIAATMGGGLVQFGGRIGFDGYLPGELNLTARGEDMRLRYPEGVRSVVDADLAVRGNVGAPTLSGTVTVKNAVWTSSLDPSSNIFNLSSLRSAAAGGVEPGAATIPLRFDVRVVAPSTLRIEGKRARLVAAADLTLRGTYDRPVLFGHAEFERGDVVFEGRRYRLTRGTIDFTNPTRLEPFFDMEAETTVRVPGQTYRVTVGLAGTPDRLAAPQLNSDPPLPSADVLALLFSDARGQGRQDFELRALRNPNERQTDILTAQATQALASPISSEVGKVFEQAFGVDTFQVTPSFIDPYTRTGRVNPSARVTIGKRISDRVYLTFSRSLNSPVYDQILLLEYDQSDRLSWILSRNEDQSYAIEFRVRHAF